MSSPDIVPNKFLAQVAFILQVCVPDGDDDDAEIAATVAEQLGDWLSYLAPDGLRECATHDCTLPAGVLTSTTHCPFHEPRYTPR